jgi:hypothetical protein
MVYMSPAEKHPLGTEDKTMLELYRELWGKGETGIIFEGRCNIPLLPTVDTQIAISIQSDQESRHARLNAGVGMDMGASPYPFKYLQLPEGLALPRFEDALRPHTNLLIRNCYETTLHLILERGVSTAVLGGPGTGEYTPISPFFLLIGDTGKSFFLLYVLVRKLLAAEPVSYQSKPGTVHCFTAKGAFAHIGDEQLLEDETMWHLLDLNNQVSEIPYPTYSGGGFMILATSPRASRYKEWIKYTGGQKLWIGPVSWEEMYIMAYVAIHDRCPNLLILSQSQPLIHSCGPNQQRPRSSTGLPEIWAHPKNLPQTCWHQMV